MQTTEILGIKVDAISGQQALEYLENIIIQPGYPGYMVVTPNPEIIIRARANKKLAEILNSADLRLADGWGVVLASRLLSGSLPERVAGFNLVQNLFERADSQGFSFYFLGSRPPTIKKAVKNISQDYPGLEICGFHHGYLDQKQEAQVKAEINKLKPDILLVGMGVPLQEEFLDNHLPELDVKIAITVGGSFDVLAGELKRAPVWMQKMYLEWVYRLFQEPSRLGRMKAIPQFIYLVLKDYLISHS